MSFSVEFAKALLNSSSTIQEQKTINSDLLPLLQESTSSLVRKLSCMLLIAEQKNSFDVQVLEEIKTKWSRILSIVEEHDIHLPEQELAIEAAISQIQEEGEGAAAPTNVSAGIDSSTPRIDPKKRKEAKDDSSIIVP